MLAVSMPNADTLSALVETATKCLATAARSPPSPLSSQSRAVSALVIASAALHPSVADLAVAIVGVRALGLGRGLFRYLERLTSHQATFSLLARLRTWFYRAIEPLAPAGLESHRTGDLLNRAIADIETLENFYVRVLAPPLVAVIGRTDRDIH